MGFTTLTPDGEIPNEIRDLVKKLHSEIEEIYSTGECPQFFHAAADLRPGFHGSIDILLDFFEKNQPIQISELCVSMRVIVRTLLVLAYPGKHEVHVCIPERAETKSLSVDPVNPVFKVLSIVFRLLGTISEALHFDPVTATAALAGADTDSLGLTHSASALKIVHRLRPTSPICARTCCIPMTR
eukprot:scaffold91150_cov24-Prasinocladus_malaysianus.AAC.1